MHPDLTGQVVLITGATGGLGETVTRVFLQAGATVGGVARSWTGKEKPPGFLPLEADLTQPDAAKRVVGNLVESTGRLDVIVHVMGGFAGGQPVQETTDDTWNSMMAMNLNAAFFVFRAGLAHMVSTGKGRIIAIGSRAGVDQGANLSAYNVSKAGLNALVRTAAAEVKDSAITVNAVLPSTIDTAANRSAMPSADVSKWVTPESIAASLLWLASDASKDINGALIPIYGRV
ncbi:MAG: SDR family NAD(P)-dependent oxidoreductase [Bryobacteraceae bacterium]